MQSYLTPSIKLHDFSKFQFAQNQATCGPEILGGATLVDDNFGSPACGFGDTGTNQVNICLSSAIDSNLLEGLTVNTTDGNSLVISNCSPGYPSGNCPSGGFICTANGIFGGGNPCIINLECPDGTNVTTCNDFSACNPS